MQLDELYQELIIDHGTQPRNCCVLDNANGTAQGFNPLCGDKVQIYLYIEKGVIHNATFTGSGCAISTASASLMTEALVGKTLEAVMVLSNCFKALLTSECPSKSTTETETGIEKINSQIVLGKLAAFSGVKAFPARVKCATLPWHTLQAAIQQVPNPVSTETP
jgi:nitrogen fixation NifU-like protein